MGEQYSLNQLILRIDQLNKLFPSERLFQECNDLLRFKNKEAYLKLEELKNTSILAKHIVPLIQWVGNKIFSLLKGNIRALWDKPKIFQEHLNFKNYLFKDPACRLSYLAKDIIDIIEDFIPTDYQSCTRGRFPFFYKTAPYLSYQAMRKDYDNALQMRNAEIKEIHKKCDAAHFELEIQIIYSSTYASYGIKKGLTDEQIEAKKKVFEQPFNSEIKAIFDKYEPLLTELSAHMLNNMKENHVFTDLAFGLLGGKEAFLTIPRLGNTFNLRLDICHEVLAYFDANVVFDTGQKPIGRITRDGIEYVFALCEDSKGNIFVQALIINPDGWALTDSSRPHWDVNFQSNTVGRLDFVDKSLLYPIQNTMWSDERIAVYHSDPATHHFAPYPMRPLDLPPHIKFRPRDLAKGLLTFDNVKVVPQLNEKWYLAMGLLFIEGEFKIGEETFKLTDNPKYFRSAP